jgi:hypothetical protein
MEPEDSLSCLEPPAAGPYPEPSESSPHPHINYLSQILTSPPIYSLQYFPSALSTNVLYKFPIASIRATCPDNLILLHFIILMIFNEHNVYIFKRLHR